MRTTDTGAGIDLARSLEGALDGILPMGTLLHAAERDRPDDAAHSALLPLGLLEVAVPETAGGLELDLSAIAEIWFVAGRHLLPMTLREEALVVAPILAALRGHAGTDRYLAGLRAGDVRGGGRMFVHELPSGGRTQVWCPPRPDVMSLVGPDAGVLFERPQVAPARGIDLGQGLADFDVDRGTPIARVDATSSRAVWLRWHVAVLAEMVGCADRALELSASYATTREQFGRPIAQFQAVAHMLADMRAALDGTRALVVRTVAEVEGGDPGLLLGIGRYWIPQAARKVCELAIQVHGGIGFTWESGLHLFYRRVLQLQAALGGAEAAATEVGRRYLAELRGRRDA